MRRRQLWTGGIVLGLVLLASAALSVVTRSILSAESLNATTSLMLPAWLDDLSEHEAVAYASHAALGVVLETLDLSPAASAVQWLKAAAHAGTDAELEWTAQGISAAVERDEGGRAFHTICKLKELGNAQQVRTVERAAIPCHRWTPEVALRADVSSRQVSPGATVQITAYVTSVTDFDGLVDVEIHTADEEKIAQWVFSHQRLVAGRQHDYAATWEVPSDLPAGEYEVKLGVFSPGWARLHGWKRFTATIDVGT